MSKIISIFGDVLDHMKDGDHKYKLTYDHNVMIHNHFYKVVEFGHEFLMLKYWCFGIDHSKTSKYTGFSSMLCCEQLIDNDSDFDFKDKFYIDFRTSPPLIHKYVGYRVSGEYLVKRFLTKDGIKMEHVLGGKDKVKEFREKKLKNILK